MNYETINNIIDAIQKLKQRGFNISLNVETIKSDFESLIEAKCTGRHILPSQYRFIKNLQTNLHKSLADITESQIRDFVHLSRAIENIRVVLSKKYETRKLISGLVRKLKSFMENTNISDDEANIDEEMEAFPILKFTIKEENIPA